MNTSTTPYARRGERDRSRRRTRRALLAAAVVITGALAMHDPEPGVAIAAPIRTPLTALVRTGPVASPVAAANVLTRTPADDGRGAALTASPRSRVGLDRWHRVYRLAGHFGVATDLAQSIHDAAVAEGIEPELAFRLVHAESEFNEHATSRVGAVGLTQVMPGTARYYVRGVSRERLYDRRLNLHVGFRYLRGLIHQYRSLRLALLVYNRGPVAVDAALKRGDDPANGYQDAVAKGYRGQGTIGFPPRVGHVVSDASVTRSTDASSRRTSRSTSR